MIYHSKRRPVLEKSVVAFFDVLGLRAQIAGATTQTAQEPLLRAVHKALHASIRHLKPKHFGSLPALWTVKSFTDNIVLGWPCLDDAESELGSVFYRAAYFQLALIRAGLFCRGAIAVGPLYMDSVMAFGSALIEAYEGETTLARDPRIILTPSAAKHVAYHLGYYADPTESPQNAYLSRDSDGVTFVDYLKIIHEEDGIAVLRSALAHHKKQIARRLRIHVLEPRFWNKYVWCARYHNHSCDRYGLTKFRLKESLFDPPPQPIVS